MVSAFLCVSGVLIATIVIEPPIFALFERLPCEHLSSPAGHPSILASLACSFGMHGASLLYNKDLYAQYPDRTGMPVATPKEAEIRPALEDGRRQMTGQLSIAPQVHSDASIAPYIHESCFILLISAPPFCCFLQMYSVDLPSTSTERRGQLPAPNGFLRMSFSLDDRLVSSAGVSW